MHLHDCMSIYVNTIDIMCIFPINISMYVCKCVFVYMYVDIYTSLVYKLCFAIVMRFSIILCSYFSVQHLESI